MLIHFVVAFSVAQIKCAATEVIYPVPAEAPGPRETIYFRAISRAHALAHAFQPKRSNQSHIKLYHNPITRDFTSAVS